MANPRGNPNWRKGSTANPNGRPPIDREFRDRCKKMVNDVVVARWFREVEEEGPEWVRCSELLAAYGFGKPVQAVSGVDGGPIEVKASVVILPAKNK